MSTIEKIKADRISAMKNKDSKISSLLSILMSDIIRVGKDKRNSDTTEDEAIQVVRKYIKSSQDNLKLKNLSSDHIESYNFEIELLSKYLPQQVSKENIQDFLNLHIGKNKGELFKLLKEKFGNTFDPKVASELIK